MNNAEIAIIFNRADEYKRGADGANRGSTRHYSFIRKHQAVVQVITDLGLLSEYTSHLVEVAA